MTLHVAVLGIDGSGKSTLAAALPVLLAGEDGLVAGSASADEFWVRTPEQDLFGPGFQPLGTPIAARFAHLFRRLAKLVVNNRAFYPSAKVFQMLTQDNAASKLAGRYSVDVMVSDGNLLLTGAGRAFNYRGPASGASPADVDLAFDHLLAGQPLPQESRSNLPNLRAAEVLAAIARLTSMHGIWAPDVVIFLDITPERALARIASRGLERDRHENEKDLSSAREGYMRVLDVARRRIGPDSVYVVDTGDMTAGDALRAAMKIIEPKLPRSGSNSSRSGALHTAQGSALRRILSYRYLGRYMVRRFFEGAWREPFFPLSAEGRTFLEQGYSAPVMRMIYDRPKSPSLPSRPFVGYPLHRAVFDRLAILERHVERELRERLASPGKVRVFTGPSGFAYDLMRPLGRIAASDAGAMRRLTLVAADLDQTGELEPELESAAGALGVEFEFLRGDMTGPELRDQAQGLGPYDVALFVGLSAWLPKPPTIAHLKWLQRNLQPGGVLLTDCFTPAAYAIGGMAMGYKASYYPPRVMGSVLEYCGFGPAEVESGPNGINHVLVTSPARPAQGDAERRALEASA
ncbi:MAG TPA: hypothetical protein VLK30_06595 [Candidatus Limnocylindrales bacterium]|nr:hypothetical protein [Candidatus Limnocylindrales bacterium]